MKRVIMFLAVYVTVMGGGMYWMANQRAVYSLPYYGGEVDGSAFCKGGLTPKPSLCANYKNNGLDALYLGQASIFDGDNYHLQYAEGWRHYQPTYNPQSNGKALAGVRL